MGTFHRSITPHLAQHVADPAGKLNKADRAWARGVRTAAAQAKVEAGLLAMEEARVDRSGSVLAPGWALIKPARSG